MAAHPLPISAHRFPRPRNFCAFPSTSTPVSNRSTKHSEIIRLENPLLEEECHVLVVNASGEMAKEITLQLTLQIAGCSIMYAPSIELANWILGRRRIDLVVTSPLLPDGSFTRLTASLEKMTNPPDVVVVGNIQPSNADLMGESKYHIATMRRFSGGSAAAVQHFPVIHRKATVSPEPKTSLSKPRLQQTIKNLGADIRNDLNNPLQEIVAMVFVAKATTESSPATAQALEAIDKAAKNMALVVDKLEGKIQNAVEVTHPVPR